MDAKWPKTFLLGKYLRAIKNAERLHGANLRVIHNEQSPFHECRVSHVTLYTPS